MAKKDVKEDSKLPKFRLVENGLGEYGVVEGSNNLIPLKPGVYLTTEKEQAVKVLKGLLTQEEIKLLRMSWKR